ncbi:MAG: hypothetical protein LBT53_01535 [Puniceicoccales bacterium]|jgi:hypothetical protein|nr:hypothetical protein [Puniceicoccales bacterium]
MMIFFYQAKENREGEDKKGGADVVKNCRDELPLRLHSSMRMRTEQSSGDAIGGGIAQAAKGGEILKKGERRGEGAKEEGRQGCGSLERDTRSSMLAAA